MTHKLPVRLEGADLTSRGQAAVVTPHVLASQAASEILNQGGNAADAAIAANATLGVVAPETCGIGGDLFALVHRPGSLTPQGLNSSGRAGSGLTAGDLREAGLTSIPIDHHAAVTVPGCVDGWEALSARNGTLPMASVLAPAIRHASEGFEASPELANALERLAGFLTSQPAAEGLYPDDRPPRPGEMLSRPALARTLGGIASHGRTAFYAGSVAEDIVAATKASLTLEDLSRIQARWIEPVSLEVMGWTGWTIPPNSQGYLTLASAWLFEQLQPPHDPLDPDFTKAAIEAYRAVGWERDEYVSDSRFAPVPDQELLSATRLSARLDRIDINSRGRWPAPRPAPGGTAYLCVKDRNGMGVSLIQSNYHGIGSRIGAGHSGFFLHDRGSAFSLVPGHANELAPGKQPLHTLSPTLWTSGEDLTMLLGTRGGDFQPQTLLQMFINMRWAETNAPTAQSMPRWATSEWWGPSDAIAYEPHLDVGTVNALNKMGHRTTAAAGWMSGWGPVSVITGSAENVIGAADPRGATTSAVGL